MKKYLLIFVLAFSFMSLNAQNELTRQQRHDQAMAQQHEEGLIKNMQDIAFRFETAFEEKDLESTKVLQNDLVTLMVKAKKAEKSMVNQKKQKAIIEKFASYKIDFNKKESAADVKFKSMPNEFIKLIK